MAALTLVLGWTQVANAQPSPASLFDDGPITVRVGIKIDQITSVDQRAETFGVVGRLRLSWSDPRLEFDAVAEGRDFRQMDGEDFQALSRERGIIAPGFSISNQQARRFIQQSLVLWQASGEAIYLEQFTATLQAPHFHFQKYPLDKQLFFVHLVPTAPLQLVQLEADSDFEGLGSLLGEEEWRITESWSEVDTVEGLTGLDSARYSFAFEAERELLYYTMRIFVPLLLLSAVSWANLFLMEYRRRIDIAGANLLVFVAFNFTISGELPRLGYLTFLDAVLAVMFVIAAATVVYNVALRRLEINEKPQTAEAIDWHLTYWLYPAIHVVALAWLLLAFIAAPDPRPFF